MVGVKLALSQQQRWWPESAVILQLGVPTGARAFSHRHLESGVNWLYGWDITERWSIAGSSGAQTGSELVLVSLPLGEFSFRDQQIVFHQSVTTGWAFTERVGGFFEYFVLHTDGDQQDRSDHFLDGGFTYWLTMILNGIFGPV
ncbi:MAG: hypothetical protein KatS3mg110_3859 [Pirellulaceae bacterium]|nr:MAG: hypothetical protein KatS3mg110_3859 [Pirellulaceae bacterium]